MSTQREWKQIKEYEEILFDFYNGIARITINRERYRNAFTPTTTTEMSDALYICRERPDICVIVLTGAGDTAFCAGGDMNVKGHGGYIGKDGVARLNVLDVQKQIRSMPKPVIAAVNGFAIGGGHVCMSFATLPSLLKMPSSDRRVLVWVVSTLVSVRRIWPELSVKRKHAKYGSFAGNTMHRKRSTWDW